MNPKWPKKCGGGSQMDLFRGRRRRDAGTSKRVQRDPLYQEEAMKRIRAFADTGAEFSAIQVRLLLEAAGITPTHPNSLGAAFISAVRSGIIRRTGYCQSTVPSAHARAIAVYVGAGVPS